MIQWYDILDFEENPFTTDPRKYTGKLVKVQDIIEESFYRIRSQNMLVIQGKEGHGKTSILFNIVNKFGGRNKIIFLDAQTLDKKLNIEMAMQESLSIIARIMHKKPRNMILLLDNVHKLSKMNCERIKYYYDQNYIRAVVFTCRYYKRVKFSESLKNRIGSRVASVPSYDAEDAIHIIRNRIDDHHLLTDALIKDIFNRSKRNPRTLLENCGFLAEYVVNKKGRERIKKIDVDLMLGGSNE